MTTENKQQHYCYVLYNDSGKTYNGYTINTSRRLRQHNGELVGGAKYTSRYNGWKFLYIITSTQFTKNTALSFEWSIKYPTNKRPRPTEYSTPEGRIKSLGLVLDNPKFSELKFDLVYCDPSYITLFKNQNFKITTENSNVLVQSVQI